MTKYTTTVPPEGARQVAVALGLPVPPWGKPLLIPPGAGERVGALVVASAAAGCPTAQDCLRIARDDILWADHGLWVVQTCLGISTLSGAAVVALRHALTKKD
jgi:hypothetical protein